MLEGTEKGGVRNSIHNCLTVFQYDPILSGAVAKNLLTERIDLLKPIGRKRRTGSKAMTDTDMKYIRLYLEDTYGLTSEKKIADAADLAADANSYHPIRDYLNGLVWDGKERIRYCLRHFLGADTDNFTYHSLRLFLLGAIHRAFCPGCKFEVMLCLVGGQGAGKSTFFRLLAVKDEWFSDDLRKLDDDNVYRKLQGHWIIEMSEMIATANAKSIEEIKSFLSRQKEVYTVKEVRPRYSCFYKIRHPGDCDGQSGYGVSKLDSIVEEVVRQIFAQFREVSRKKLLESVKTNDAARIQKKIKKIQKDLEAKQKELDDLKAETILVIRGVSALDKELLGTLVAEAKDALETLEKQLVQAQEEYEEATKTAKRSNYICNELFTWADVYDTANHDERRAILQQFIAEIRVRKDYEISITLNASFNQVEQLKAVSTYDGAEIFEEISEKGA